MIKAWTVLAVVLCFLLNWPLSLRATEGGDSTQVSRHAYIGAAKCKMCHPKQYKSWSATKMGTTFADLKGDEAKDPKCVKCHVTGFGKGGYAIGGTNDPDLTNVQCEACHGPGSDFKSVMQDKDKAVAAGLVISPDEKVCLGCHNKESTDFKGFDYSKMKEMVHPLPKK